MSEMFGQVIGPSLAMFVCDVYVSKCLIGLHQSCGWVAVRELQISMSPMSGHFPCPAVE